MFMCFPSDERTKARLDAICKSLNISLEEWFESALKSSKFDVMVKFLDNPEDQTSWMWDEELSRFVRRFEDE
ncbi:hypothetical protein E4K67_04230 [Desulfosporosinus fructosivorans]|uniref:Uncharacterized protein n=1 Tax=Desulfosporosinus fructosivorans TaxID=2018669 RepID=A0A4Z0R6M6_9FIRM|nr:hypothetical protein [Desulfosporosinus fructosivorans]TGE38702.1 hypothetical protein E4K67_04230 [Desulfosporosinus fructosivorans]